MSDAGARAVILALAITAPPATSFGQAPVTRLDPPLLALQEPFTDIVGVIELAPGRLLVADGAERRLAVFHAQSGEWELLGRVGSGLREFRSMGRLLSGPDGGVSWSRTSIA
jgi:hypothetical protein